MASGKSNLFIQKSRHIGPRIARQPSRAIALDFDSLAAYPPARGADPENTASHQFGFRMARTL